VLQEIPTDNRDQEEVEFLIEAHQFLSQRLASQTDKKINAEIEEQNKTDFDYESKSNIATNLGNVI
jgi:hypothetical protein